VPPALGGMGGSKRGVGAALVAVGSGVRGVVWTALARLVLGWQGRWQGSLRGANKGCPHDPRAPVGRRPHLFECDFSCVE
jgi:hypothetical protein